MNNPDTKAQFLAILIYEDGEGWICEEPHVYTTSHPEIAYQLALATGNEQRYGRTFVGLSCLEETSEEIEPIARLRQGDAHQRVQSKTDLQAFNDPRWQSTLHDENELCEALTEPDFLMDIPGLDDTPWHTLKHAYGSAYDVPKDIRRLTSSSDVYRENALWHLFGSIYHQGTVYSATVTAVPFLLQILVNTSLPDRGQVAELLEALAESAAFDPAQIAARWQWLGETFGEIYERPSSEMAAEEVAACQSVLQCLVDNLPHIQQLADDSDVDVARHAQAALAHLASIDAA
ncbi:MAG: hypothetical protein AAGF95_25010 [Chloroflexota bacterium]